MSHKLTPQSRIYVAGHRGLVGAALVRQLEARGCSNLLLSSRAELDLRNQQAVSNFFISNRPDYVFLAAAKVGGILANSTKPAEFLYDNLAIQTNVIHEAWRTGVRKLVFLDLPAFIPSSRRSPLKKTPCSPGHSSQRMKRTPSPKSQG